MPELPDIVIYLEALEKRILHQTLDHVRILSPFLLRTAVPPLTAVEGKQVTQLRRMGKRICIGLEGDLWLVLHLMIAGRLHWKERGVKLSRPRGLAAFDFPHGSLLWTEAGLQKRASLHIVQGEAALHSLDPGGLEVLDATPGAIRRRAHLGQSHPEARAHRPASLQRNRQRLLRRNPLAGPALAHAAHPEAQACRHRPRARRHPQHAAEVGCRLARRSQRQFPREGHRLPRRYGRARPLQPALSSLRKFGTAYPLRQQEANYCPHCQTGGKLLADRALSRLLREDWPRTPEELETLMPGRAGRNNHHS